MSRNYDVLWVIPVHYGDVLFLVLPVHKVMGSNPIGKNLHRFFTWKKKMSEIDWQDLKTLSNFEIRCDITPNRLHTSGE